MTACGLAPEQIDELTWWDVSALTNYWQDFPPAHECLKIGFGLERRAEPAPPGTPSHLQTGDDPSGIGSLIAQCPTGFVPANR